MNSENSIIGTARPFHPKILLCRVHAGDELSGVIRAVTRTEYTHAMILKGIERGQYIVSEAYWPHVRERPLLDSELAGIDAFDVPMDDLQATKVLAYCAAAEAAHEPYSLENLLRFNPLLRRIFGEATDLSDKSPVICSQYAFDAFDRGGGIKLLNAPSYEIAPGYLAWSTLLIPFWTLPPLDRASVTLDSIKGDQAPPIQAVGAVEVRPYAEATA